MKKRIPDRKYQTLVNEEVLLLSTKQGYIPLLPLFLNPLFLVCKIAYRVAEIEQNNVTWQALNNNIMIPLP